MADRKVLNDVELDNVTGGKITYTWNGEVGSIGINGNNNFVLLNKDAFGAYYSQYKDVKTEKDILKDLLAQGVIRRP